MQVPSAIATTALEPTMEPARWRAPHSIGVSAIAAGRNPDDAPEGATALSARPSRTPPACSLITARRDVPKGIS